MWLVGSRGGWLGGECVDSTPVVVHGGGYTVERACVVVLICWL